MQVDPAYIKVDPAYTKLFSPPGVRVVPLGPWVGSQVERPRKSAHVEALMQGCSALGRARFAGRYLPGPDEALDANQYGLWPWSLVACWRPVRLENISPC